ncbi:hypothetical protein LB579_27635 [Mesorhizobium sp. BR1-1-7]|uniref:hypothetical protein n=1 Tax=Mesorhizobium sp. BR1-1-7 TaxID=2876647 RepID=UPI001CCED124|nr:hypothetical protein [Mesorhizobium sp. BR1-1-7]MBZ9921472.1 hypothetical protein [Mesorhizobium sp. BR1-1-7]
MARRYKDFDTALLAYRNRPEGPIEPVKTNWSVIPANDNNPEDVVDLGIERSWRITPSVAEIMASVATKEVARNDRDQIVRIGKLRFSDGEQTERAYCYGPEGKLMQYDARLPVGAMMGTRDKPDSQLGGTGYTERATVLSNSYYAEVFDVDYPQYVKAGKRKRGDVLITPEEQRELLAGPLPPITVCQPGLPTGSERVADSFIGLRKGKKGESGAIGWEDIAMSKVHREVWEETLAYLSQQDVETLDAALDARTLADIAPGGHKRSAQRRGKRDLRVANDNLVSAMKIAAA